MENEITIITSDNIIFNVSANIRNILQAPILNSNPVKLLFKKIIITMINPPIV